MRENDDEREERKKQRLEANLQRAQQIRRAGEGESKPGDPEHGKWQRVDPPTDPIARPIGGTLPIDTLATPYPTRQAAPISTAADNLAQFNRIKGIPIRRAISPGAQLT